MSDVPAELYYAKSHEWVRKNDDGTLTVGISDHAQELLGDLVFVDVPDVGSCFDQAEDCAVVESVKAASDIYCPVAGEVIEVNEALADSPEIINSDPYVDGWIFNLKPTDLDELDELLSAEDYAAYIAAEED